MNANLLEIDACIDGEGHLIHQKHAFPYVETLVKVIRVMAHPLHNLFEDFQPLHPIQTRPGLHESILGPELVNTIQRQQERPHFGLVAISATGGRALPTTTDAFLFCISRPAQSSNNFS